MNNRESKFHNKTQSLVNVTENSEKFIHDLIIKDGSVRNDIFSILDISNISRIKLLHEVRFSHGISADFVLLVDNKIRAIIECKGFKVGINDFVRGIGQVLQYESFKEKNVDIGFDYSETFNTILIYPSSIIRNNLSDFKGLKYPKSTIIIEINDGTNISRTIKPKDYSFKDETSLDVSIISQYYIRDNRLFELYLLLKYLIMLQKSGSNKKIDRKNLENNILRRLDTPNNRNWRNAFISLSSLGFINKNNFPTENGKKIGQLDYEDFLIIIYRSYIGPYIDEITEFFCKKSSNLNLSNADICQEINKIHDDNEILFLTESKGRYMSSWLNIMRDDYGIIDFMPRSSLRKINYITSEYDDNELRKKIVRNTNANQYIDRLNLLK